MNVPPRLATRFSCSLAFALLVMGGAPARAQHDAHAGHDMANMNADTARRMTSHVMAQAIPLVTRAAPTAESRTVTEGALTQALVMARIGWWGGRAALDATLNGEGLLMKRGELNTSASGEGFVDRRHPHAYVHELMLTGQGTAGPARFSVSAGRGFAPFGTDDPMMRPVAKYPANHHLAQILERGILTGAVRAGRAIVEGATFGGEEPTGPAALPRASRFGDSWAARFTVLPVQGLEVQGSYARVASPEQPGGFGLDQRKQSWSARAISPRGSRYLLAEWARTVDHDHNSGLDAFRYETALVEGAIQAGSAGLALRLEQTERPEEEREADPFRTARPGSDLGIHGITRWRTVTAHLAAPAVTRGVLAGFPFIEVARLAASPRDAWSPSAPQRLYGTTRFWMFTAGLRIRVGSPHARMGRYGVAVPNGPPIAAMSGLGSGPTHQH